MSLLFEFCSVGVLCVILVADVVLSARKSQSLSAKKSLVYVLVYSLLAVFFGILLLKLCGPKSSIEFFSGWLTEYSLSIDNLFVFIIIINNFKVPKHLQSEALGVGVIIALILRGIFIALGSVVIERFSWVFYVFGAFLIYTSIKILVEQEGSHEYHENFIVRFFYKIIPMSKQYNGAKITIKDNNNSNMTRFTPLLIVFISLGVTDLFFAFDSIPAIFGLTKDPFIVFTTNIFALMGLQKLYFVLGSLVEKLQFLPIGLSIILAFIGFKLILEALNGSGFDWAIEIPTSISLLVIAITVSITASASVLKIRLDYKDELIRKEKSEQLQ